MGRQNIHIHLRWTAKLRTLKTTALDQCFNPNYVFWRKKYPRPKTEDFYYLQAYFKYCSIRLSTKNPYNSHFCTKPTTRRLRNAALDQPWMPDLIPDFINYYLNCLIVTKALRFVNYFCYTHYSGITLKFFVKINC